MCTERALLIAAVNLVNDETLGQCSEPNPALRVPLLQCRDEQHHRLCAENTLEMFFPRSQWTPVSHFQEPPVAGRDEEPVPKS